MTDLSALRVLAEQIIAENATHKFAARSVSCPPETIIALCDRVAETERLESHAEKAEQLLADEIEKHQSTAAENVRLREALDAFRAHCDVKYVEIFSDPHRTFHYCAICGRNREGRDDVPEDQPIQHAGDCPMALSTPSPSADEMVQRIRNEALEEAAKIADAEYEPNLSGMDRHGRVIEKDKERSPSWRDGRNLTALRITDMIRAKVTP